MYKYMQDYSLGWVDDVLVELMAEKQKQASNADAVEAMLLWDDVHNYERLRKALVRAGKLARDWQKGVRKES